MMENKVTLLENNFNSYFKQCSDYVTPNTDIDIFITDIINI